jgi:hypothetical protein
MSTTLELIVLRAAIIHQFVQQWVAMCATEKQILALSWVEAVKANN